MFGKITSYKCQSKNCSFLTDKNFKVNLKIASDLNNFIHFNKNDVNFLGKKLKGIYITGSDGGACTITPFDALNKEVVLHFVYIHAIIDNDPNDTYALLYAENKSFGEDYPKIKINVEFMERENVWKNN